ncbi:lysozyme [Tundrisphaera sp. TA3]|uniref:lysozyme n=1 Tax=Tundrisphaera sp. TA3 TaxID=3435775 RepID=UPI003EBFA035
MRTNEAGLALIKRFEGFRSRPYKCPAGVWTIGYGHTRGVTARTPPATMEQAEEFLRLDLADSERIVGNFTRAVLNENEFSALASLCFNIGSGNYLKSTLLAKLNGGDRIGAANEFPRWNRSNGAILPGLVSRRAAERELFLRPVA